MKRKIFSILFALVLVLSFSLVTAVPVAAQGNTWYVATDGSDTFGNGTETWVDEDPADWSIEDTGPWLTISYAISQASDTDTIIVAEGTYYETIDVTVDGLTIQSLSGNTSDTIIDANGADHTVVSILSSNVIFSGFTITGAIGYGYADYSYQGNSGVYMDDVEGCHLSDLIIDDIGRETDGFGIGLFVHDSSDNIFESIAISNIVGGASAGQIFGILLKLDSGGSHRNSFTDITIDTITTANPGLSSAVGIMSWGQNNDNTFDTTKITNLTAPQAACGIRGDGEGNSFTSTEISSLTSSLKAYAILLEASVDNTFEGTTISNIAGSVTARGVYLYGGYGNNYGNSFTSTDISGLTGDTTHGIYIYGGPESNSFNGGSISGAQRGVYISGNCPFNSIHNTNIDGNTEYGAFSDTVALDATRNWWGDDQGPDHASNPRTTTGDSVSDNVIFLPWLGAPYPDGQVCNAAQNEDEWYFTIQEAINDASPNDSVNVAAGTYAEHLTITAKSNLTIQSTEDAEIVPISTPWKTPIIKVDSSTDITIRGLVIDGKNEVDPFSYSWGGAPTGVGILFKDSTGTIEGNEVRNFNLNSYPVERRGTPVGTGIIVLYDCPQVTIKGNDIISYHASGIRLCYGFEGNIINIIDNVITGRGEQSFYSGESIRIDAASTVNIIGNELSNNIYTHEDYFEYDAAGVTIDGKHGGLPVVNIRENDILNNTFGIIVERADGAVVEAHFNNIVDNGVVSTAPNRGGATAQDIRVGIADPNVWPINTTLNATYNWWGDVTGPDHATLNPSAQGNAVSGNVLFSPWLYKTQDTIVPTKEPAYAQSVVLDNTGAYGWNTFSTPIFLDGSADTWADLCALTGLDYSIAYRYDPASDLPFVLLNAYDDQAITPGEGLFIKMNTAGSLPILYSTAENLMPPSRALTIDWNLIGLASMKDMDVEDAFFSLAGEGQIVSPTGNESPGAVLAGDTVYVGEGYWVYMLGERTLVGYTTTPVKWVP